MASRIAKVVRELRGRIGKDGETRQGLEQELMGRLMAAAMGMDEEKEEEEPEVSRDNAVPLPESDPMYALVVRIQKATDQGDEATLHELIAEDCTIDAMGMEVRFWDSYTPEMFQMMQENNMQTTLDGIELLERTAERVTLIVSASSSGGFGASSGSTRYVFKNESGKWLLSRMKVESASMSMGTSN